MNTKRWYIVFYLLITIVLAAGCSPSQEEIATQTAVAEATEAVVAQATATAAASETAVAQATAIIKELLTAENMTARLCNEEGFCGMLLYVRNTPEAYPITKAYIDTAFDGSASLFRAFMEHLEGAVGAMRCQPDESEQACRERTAAMCFPAAREGALYFPEEQDGRTCAYVAAFVPATIGSADMPPNLGTYDPILMVMVGQGEFEHAFPE